jgi:hypothetical protein
MEASIDKVVAGLKKHLRESMVDEIKVLNFLMDYLERSDTAERADILSTSIGPIFVNVATKKEEQDETRKEQDEIWAEIESCGINPVSVINNVMPIWDQYRRGITKHVYEYIIPCDFEDMPSCRPLSSILLFEFRDACAKHRPDLVTEIDKYVGDIISSTIVAGNYFYADFDVDIPYSRKAPLEVSF